MAVKILGFVYFLLFAVNCSTTEPPPPPDGDNPELTLILEDATCREVWIKLTTSNLQLPTPLTLKQNDTTKEIINLTTADTLLYIDSLLPVQQYTIQATIQSSSHSSNELSVTTMDTTSHDFTWQSWTFGGEIASSRLDDVAMINENDIWAVGEIWIVDDTSSLGYTKYNAVHWDGTNWELKRIYYYGSCSAVKYPPLKAIWAFSGNDIVITNGGSIGWFNGETVDLDCEINPLLTGAITKLWGSTSTDFYAVGNAGNIAHYQSGNWSKINSRTDVDIQDIWGIENGPSGEPLILCAASYVAQSGEKKILRITNNTQVDTIYWATGRRVHSLWFNSINKLYASGGGVFIRSYDDNWVEQTELPLYFTERVRGKDKNDLFVVGHFGLLAHFNGSTWKTYPEASTALVYTSLDYKDNLMVTVGYTQDQAVVQFMRKN